MQGILSLIIVIFLFMAPYPVSAQQPSCNLESPTEVRSNDPNANLVIDVGDNQQRDASSNPTVSQWRIETVCSWSANPLTNSIYVATPQGSNKIVATINNNGLTTCEFNSSNGTVGVKVQAFTGGSFKDWCSVRFNVINAANLCRLDLSPTSGITPATNLTVSGSNILTGGRFVLFFDSFPMGQSAAIALLPGLAEVPTPSFPAVGEPPLVVPNNLLSLGNHRISLRQKVPPNIISTIVSGAAKRPLTVDDFFNPPACFVDFSVGTQQNPGSKKGEGNTGTPGTENIAAKCTGGNCSRSAGQTCTFKGGDGILTALGCVPYEPVAFAQGILSFVISIAGGIALVIMIFGAYEMITSSGNPDTLKKGQERFTGAILGLLFIIFSVLLLKIIGVDILDIPFLD